MRASIIWAICVVLAYRSATAELPSDTANIESSFLGSAALVLTSATKSASQVSAAVSAASARGSYTTGSVSDFGDASLTSDTSSVSPSPITLAAPPSRQLKDAASLPELSGNPGSPSWSSQGGGDKSTVLAAGLELGELRQGSLMALGTAHRHQDIQAVAGQRGGLNRISVWQPEAVFLSPSSSMTPAIFITSTANTNTTSKRPGFLSSPVPGTTVSSAPPATSASGSPPDAGDASTSVCVILDYTGEPDLLPTEAQVCGPATRSTFKDNILQSDITQNIQSLGGTVVSWKKPFCSNTIVAFCTSQIQPSSRVPDVRSAINISLPTVFSQLFLPDVPKSCQAAKSGLNASAWRLMLTNEFPVSDGTAIYRVFTCKEMLTKPPPQQPEPQQPTDIVKRPDTSKQQPCTKIITTVPFQLQANVTVEGTFSDTKAVSFSPVNKRIPCFALTAGDSRDGSGALAGCDTSRVTGIVILRNGSLQGDLKGVIFRIAAGDKAASPPASEPGNNILSLTLATLPGAFPTFWTVNNVKTLAAKSRGKVCLDINPEKLDDFCMGSSCAVSLYFKDTCCTDWKLVSAQPAVPPAPAGGAGDVARR